MMARLAELGGLIPSDSQQTPQAVHLPPKQRRAAGNWKEQDSLAHASQS